MSVGGISTDTSYLTYLLDQANNTSNTTPDFTADFESIDSANTGIITQTEFEQAFAGLDWPDSLKAAGADAIFAQLDPSGTGRVQLADFVSGMNALAATAAPAATSQSSASSSGLSGISALFAPTSSPSATSQTATDQAAAPAASGTLSADAQAALQQTFETAYTAIDTSNTGYITAPQLAQAFGSLTLPDSIEALGYSGIMANLDPNFTGQISHSDFVSGLLNLASTASPPAATSTTSQVAAPATAGTTSSTDAQALQQTFEAAYAAIDTSNSGYITAPQLAQAFGSLTLPASIEALGTNGILAQLDPNFTGQISHSDFVSGLLNLASTASAPTAASAAVGATPSTDTQAALQQTLETAYAAIDTSNAGYITAQQLTQAFGSLTLPASIEALGANGILAKLDPNFTGQISHSDFVSGLVNLASTASAPAAASSASDSTSSTGAGETALTQFYSNVFASIAPAGSDSITADDLANGFDQLQLPASLSSMTPNDLYARLDPFSTGAVSQADFVSVMTSLVAAANAQDAAAAAAAQPSGGNDFASMFATIDTSGSGSITLRQFETAFASLQLDPAIASLGSDVIFSMLDPNATDDSVSEDDFVDGMDAIDGAVAYFRKVASSIDSDGNGLITPEEFSQAFNSLQLPAAVKSLGATAVYGQIDPYYTNQVSVADLIDGLTMLVAQSGLPVDAAATTSSTSSGDLILSTFYRGGVAS